MQQRQLYGIQTDRCPLVKHRFSGDCSETRQCRSASVYCYHREVLSEKFVKAILCTYRWSKVEWFEYAHRYRCGWGRWRTSSPSSPPNQVRSSCARPAKKLRPRFYRTQYVAMDMEKPRRIAARSRSTDHGLLRCAYQVLHFRPLPFPRFIYI